ncbi:LuxR C-terminal-related transcriptional regulator [Tranquillimonas alkanivorans]|uniref:Two component transcriptional regulator, LuxR family n=1 Tax=Tranquillimonas alkanivorans TaxID=441119 RepID=A0A1I5MEE3_9RHOB|nr:response regulator transcription factor [Tranquillimonas alkanivorans]SFP07955.1 two component transcriptional regulator, LuxR family [Tranquillimonas alkanivorans]
MFSDEFGANWDATSSVQGGAGQSWREVTEAAKRPASAARGAALIADDDEFFRMALGVILTDRLGFAEVIEATSLDDALDQLSSRSDISLALFDLAMPGMKSAASLRSVREEFAALKIAVISGSRRRSDILTALTSGVHGYIPKSIGATNLYQTLTMVLEGQIYVPQSITEIDGGEAQEADQAQPKLDSLSPRQRDVLNLLILGKSNKEIARVLDLGEGTVKVHMSALFRSLGTRSRSAAAAVGAKILAG